MGVRIKSTGASLPDGEFSVIQHSARAAREAIARAGIAPERVGALINTGVFRDRNTVEPAIAALIQKSAGIGLEYAPHDPRTFAFDLMNGATGVLNAVQVATAILATASAEYVLVVSGDTHPSLSRGTADTEFPYATAGSALLLEAAGDDGFGRVHFARAVGGPGESAYADIATFGAHGRSAMTVVRDPDFEHRLLEQACRAARASLADGAPVGGLALIAATPTAAFPRLLAERLGIAPTAVFTADTAHGDPHTASLPLAYDRAVRANALAGYGEMLFVAAGAGPVAAAVRYRGRPATAVAA